MLCDWTDKKKSLILYKISKSYVRHVMVGDKTHEITSFKQSKLEKYIIFNTQTGNKGKNAFEKDV